MYKYLKYFRLVDKINIKWHWDTLKNKSCSEQEQYSFIIKVQFQVWVTFMEVVHKEFWPKGNFTSDECKRSHSQKTRYFDPNIFGSNILSHRYDPWMGFLKVLWFPPLQPKNRHYRLILEPGDSDHELSSRSGYGSLSAALWSPTAPYKCGSSIEGWVKCSGQISVWGQYSIPEP